MELAPRHKFLRAVASSDILKQVFSTTADAMLFRLNTRKTGNNTVEKTVEMSQAHCLNVSQIKTSIKGFNVNQNWETVERFRMVTPQDFAEQSVSKVRIRADH